MIIPFIPFFLVARLASDDPGQNVPEFVFEAVSNLTGIPVSDEKHKLISYASAMFSCRPKGQDTLRCTVGSMSVWSFDAYTPDGKEAEIPPPKERNITSEPFDIKFNDNGIDYLVVSQSVNALGVITLKEMLDQLNIGAVFNGVPDSVFETTQTSLIGTCPVTFNISRYPSEPRGDEIKPRRYELESLPPLNKVSGETIEIHRTTDLSNCSSYADFYYGGYAGKVLDSRVDSNLESVSNRIRVTDTSFISATTKKGRLGSFMNHANVDLEEIITVKLAGVRSVKDEMWRISKPQKTSIVANAEEESISYPD